MLPLFLLLACRPKTSPDIATDSGTGDGGHSQTTTWIDTGTPGTGDAGSTEPTEPTEPAPALVGVEVYPRSLRLSPGAVFRPRLVGTWDDGRVVDGAETATWTAGDAALLEVVGDGTVRALAAGEVELTGCLEGVCADLPLRIEEGAALRLRVVARESGEPISGARLGVGAYDTEHTADSDGWIELTGLADGNLDLTVWARERVPLTVAGVAGRDLVLPLRAKAELSAVGPSITGAVDLSGVPRGGAGDMKMGVAAPSLPYGPLLILPSQLVAPDRELSLYGLTADVPANVYLRDVAEDYAVPAVVGPTGVWTLAAPMAIADVTAGMAGVTDVLALMLEDLDKLVAGWHEPLWLAEGETGTANLAPATTLDERLVVPAGSLPVGFRGDEEILVMLGERLVEGGFLPIGVGVGKGSVEVHHGSPSLGASEGRAVALAAQVGGIGSGKGNALCASWAPLDELDLNLRALQQTPAVLGFEPSTRAWSVETDPRAQFVLVGIDGGAEGKHRELLLDGGPTSGVLPHMGDAFGYGDTTWSLIALETTTGTREDWLREGFGDIGLRAAASWSSASLEVDP